MKEHRILNRQAKETFGGQERRGRGWPVLGTEHAFTLRRTLAIVLFCLLTTTTNAFQVPGTSTGAEQTLLSRRGMPLSPRYRQQQFSTRRQRKSFSSWSRLHHGPSSIPTHTTDKSSETKEPLLSFSPQRRNAVIRVSIASLAMFVISNLRNRHKLKLNASISLILAVFLAMVERSRNYIARMRANASKLWQSVEAHYVAGGANLQEHQEEQEKARAAEQVTIVGTVVNVFLTLFKLFAGIVGKSSAMVADAGHSLSDLASDVVTLWAVRIARVPADADHPYGHGRFEALGALAVAGMLLTAAVGFGTFAYESFITMMTGKVMNESGPTGKIALVAAVLSIVSKEIMYRATAVVAQRTESQVLLANAWHHRSDAFSSVVALVSIWGATAGGIPALDPLGGLFVAGMVGITGLRVGWSAFKQLTDTQDFELKAAVERAVEKAIRKYKLQDDVVGYDVKARFLGSRAWVDLEVETNPSRTTSAATQVIKVLKNSILCRVPSVTDVAVVLQAKHDPEVDETKGQATESTTVTPRQVEANVRKALRNSSAFQGGTKRLRDVSSVMTHFSASSTACDVDIIVSADEDSNLSVLEAKELANIVRDDVIQHAEGVVDAKVSLELVCKQEDQQQSSSEQQQYSSDISTTLR